MKRYGYLYEKIYDIDTLRVAHTMAGKGKTHYKEVQMVDKDPDKYLFQLQEQLKKGTYKTSQYTTFNLVDRGKLREIAKLPYYPDRICHWAIMLVLEPIFLSQFIYDTYASIPGKGGHKALKRIEYAIKNNDLPYCLKFDIRKFFPSINKSILKKKLTTLFKDKKLLNLLNEIIDSYPKGIPIGNYLSQYFANYYLSKLDHYIKETLSCKYYYRYMDDMVILSDNKDELHTIFQHIKSFVENNLKLTIKGNYQVFPIDSRGIDFLGYVIRKEYTRLRKSTANRIKKKHNSIIKKQVTKKDRRSFASYFGWAKHGNCKKFSKKYITFNIWRADHEII